MAESPRLGIGSAKGRRGRGREDHLGKFLKGDIPPHPSNPIRSTCFTSTLLPSCAISLSPIRCWRWSIAFFSRRPAEEGEVDGLRAQHVAHQTRFVPDEEGVESATDEVDSRQFFGGGEDGREDLEPEFGREVGDCRVAGGGCG